MFVCGYYDISATDDATRVRRFNFTLTDHRYFEIRSKTLTAIRLRLDIIRAIKQIIYSKIPRKPVYTIFTLCSP